jgi:hypothetical protein
MRGAGYSCTLIVLSALGALNSMFAQDNQAIVAGKLTVAGESNNNTVKHVIS